MEAIPREQFIMPAFLEKSYEDTALPIASGQTISQPTIVAAMTEALELNDRSRVLEVGTGSGYQTAILAKLARMVYSIERFENLSKEAEVLLSDMNLRNVNIRCADGFSGWPEAAPFERIIVTAAADEIPAVLLGQLSNENGIMIIPVGEDPSKQVLLKVRKTPHDLNITELMNVRFVPMIEGVVAQ